MDKDLRADGDHGVWEVDTQLGLALAQACGAYDGGAPERSQLLSKACRSTAAIGSNATLSRLLTGRSLAMRLALAVALLLGLVTLVVLLPQISLTPHGLRADFGTAWAERKTSVLVYDFGQVTNLQTGTPLHYSSADPHEPLHINTLTLAQAKATVDALRAEVQDYSASAHLAAPLGVSEYHVNITEGIQHIHNGARLGGWGPGLSYSTGDIYVACIVLPDASIAETLKRHVDQIVNLPQARLADATWFTAKGLPDPGEPGVTIGLPLIDLHALGPAANATPLALVLAEICHDSKTPQQPVFFSYPEYATAGQIKTQLGAWLAANRPEYDYKIELTMAGERDNRDVTIKLEGVHLIDLKGARVDDFGNPLSVASSAQWAAPVDIDSGRLTGTTEAGPSVSAALQIVEGNPAIAFFDAAGTLSYVRSATLTGSQAVDWQGMVKLDAVRGGFVGLAVTDGNPALAYCGGADHRVHFVRAANSTGIGQAAWGQGMVVDEKPLGTNFSELSLLTVAGKPALAYCDANSSSGQSRLKYVQANGPSGMDATDWPAPLYLDQAGAACQSPAAVVIAGKPALCYHDGARGGLWFMRCGNGDGMLAADWPAPTAVDSIVKAGLYPSLAVINGRPAISYYDCTNTNGELCYNAAADIAGGRWGQRQRTYFPSWSWYTTLAEIGGRPAICFYDGGYSTLKLQQAGNTDGSAWADPVDPDQAPGQAAGQFPVLAVVQGQPAIAYYDRGGGRFKYVVMLAGHP